MEKNIRAFFQSHEKTISILYTLLLLSVLVFGKNFLSKPHARADPMDPVPLAPAEYPYLLRASQTQLHLYESQDGAFASQPVAAYPISLEALPPHDRSTLSHGLALRNQEELRAALEDFLFEHDIQ